MQPSSVNSRAQWSQFFDGLLTVFTALFPIRAKTSGSARLTAPPSPGRLLVGGPGDLTLLFGDIPRLDSFRAGEARGDTEALGEAAGRGDGFLEGVLLGVRGDGVRLEELAPATVSRLVGLFRLGEAVWVLRPRVFPGDLERLRGEPGTDRVLRGDTGRENVVLGEPGMERAFLQPDPGIGRDRPPQQSSSSSLSSLLCL